MFYGLKHGELIHLGSKCQKESIFESLCEEDKERVVTKALGLLFLKLGREQRASKKDLEAFQQTGKMILKLILEETKLDIYLTSFDKHLLIFNNKSLQEWDIFVLLDLMEMLSSRIAQEAMLLNILKKEIGLSVEAIFGGDLILNLPLIFNLLVNKLGGSKSVMKVLKKLKIYKEVIEIFSETYDQDHCPYLFKKSKMTKSEKKKKLFEYLEKISVQNRNQIDGTVLDIIDIKNSLKGEKIEIPSKYIEDQSLQKEMAHHFALVLSSCPELLQKIRISISKRGLIACNHCE